MKKPILLSFFLLNFIVLWSQDTIKVQTFEWSSNTRSEVFQFPDNPNETYRKIWMKYNMRCHDNLIGSGAVGCREWDYSCNTFITDSTRVDSTRLFHPSHIVSNFSGDVFNYTNSPVYDYLQYQQHNTATTISNEVGDKIGAGTEAFQIAADQEVGKIQSLFTAAELMAAGLSAGEIHALDLFPMQDGQIGFLRIRLKATSKTALSPFDPDTEGFEEVYFKNTEIESGAAQRFNFYQPFDWDGTSNMIVELSFAHQPDGSSPTFEATSSALSQVILVDSPDHALHFEGSGNVEVPTGNFSTITNEITISLWSFGIPEILPINNSVFYAQDNAGNRQVNVHFPWSNGQIYWDCGNDGSNYDRINKVADESSFEGKWNHWAFTKNAVSGDMKIYLNGELFHSGTGNIRPIEITEFIIGSALNGGNPYYGTIDEFRVWDIELDQATIQEFMRNAVDPGYSGYSNLIAYYKMDEGAGFTTENLAVNGGDGAIILPVWKRIRGKDLYKNFRVSAERPNLAFIQGDAMVQDEVVAVVDSIISAQHTVRSYDIEVSADVDGNDMPVVIGTENLYQAGYSYVLTESGEVVDSVWFEPDGQIEISDLTYFERRFSKYEILSLVTPYGNGLGLGAAGKTFTFDVTDYAPILKGEKRISIELGGQWQEELDIEFLFIKGTPEREVQNIQNIWPFRRGYYGQIQSDQFFEPRTIELSPNGEHFKLRSAITGHGQNGEFVPRSHYLNVDGGAQDFVYDVWKECADNPIYPQGGTWIFDRAGWCPGAATDVHEFDITNMVTPGGTVEIDYGVNGAYMDQANYLVSNQLVTYGAYNFNNDASIERIARPNSSDVEFERINPACSTPLVFVKNTGANTITSLTIIYGVAGNGGSLEFDWTGQLLPGALMQVELPVTSLGFWNTADDTKIFEAAISQVNGGDDENAANNMASSAFELAAILENDKEHLLYVRTNNNGSEYSYTLKNEAGDLVMERDNMLSNTIYEDALDLLPGCYTLTFHDAGHDGLSFWFFPENGNGSLSIKKYFTPTVLLPVKSFDPDFGSGVQYDFVVEEVVPVQENQKSTIVGTYPNPATDELNVELKGFEGKEISIEISNINGQVLRTTKIDFVDSDSWRSQLNISTMVPGMYFLRVKTVRNVWVNEFVKL